MNNSDMKRQSGDKLKQKCENVYRYTFCSFLIFQTQYCYATSSEKHWIVPHKRGKVTGLLVGNIGSLCTQFLTGFC